MIYHVIKEGEGKIVEREREKKKKKEPNITQRQ